MTRFFKRMSDEDEKVFVYVTYSSGSDDKVSVSMESRIDNVEKLNKIISWIKHTKTQLE